MSFAKIVLCACLLAGIFGRSLSYTIIQRHATDRENYNTESERILDHTLRHRALAWPDPPSHHDWSQQLLNLFYLTQVIAVYRIPSNPPSNLDHIIQQLLEPNFQSYLRGLLRETDGFEDLTSLDQEYSTVADSLHKEYFVNDQRQLIPAIYRTLSAIHLENWIDEGFRSRLDSLKDEVNRLTVDVVREEQDIIRQLTLNRVTTEKPWTISNLLATIFGKQGEVPFDEKYDVITENDDEQWDSDDVEELWVVIDDSSEEESDPEWSYENVENPVELPSEWENNFDPSVDIVNYALPDEPPRPIPNDPVVTEPFSYTYYNVLYETTTGLPRFTVRPIEPVTDTLHYGITESNSYTYHDIAVLPPSQIRPVEPVTEVLLVKPNITLNETSASVEVELVNVTIINNSSSFGGPIEPVTNVVLVNTTVNQSTTSIQVDPQWEVIPTATETFSNAYHKVPETISVSSPPIEPVTEVLVLKPNITVNESSVSVEIEPVVNVTIVNNSSSIVESIIEATAVPSSTTYDESNISIQVKPVVNVTVVNNTSTQWGANNPVVTESLGYANHIAVQESIIIPPPLTIRPVEPETEMLLVKPNTTTNVSYKTVDVEPAINVTIANNSSILPVIEPIPVVPRTPNNESIVSVQVEPVINVTIANNSNIQWGALNPDIMNSFGNTYHNVNKGSTVVLPPATVMPIELVTEAIQVSSNITTNRTIQSVDSEPVINVTVANNSNILRPEQPDYNKDNNPVSTKPSYHNYYDVVRETTTVMPIINGLPINSTITVNESTLSVHIEPTINVTVTDNSTTKPVQLVTGVHSPQSLAAVNESLLSINVEPVVNVTIANNSNTQWEDQHKYSSHVINITTETSTEKTETSEVFTKSWQYASISPNANKPPIKVVESGVLNPQQWYPNKPYGYTTPPVVSISSRYKYSTKHPIFMKNPVNTGVTITRLPGQKWSQSGTYQPYKYDHGIKQDEQRQLTPEKEDSDNIPLEKSEHGIQESEIVHESIGETTGGDGSDGLIELVNKNGFSDYVDTGNEATFDDLIMDPTFAINQPDAMFEFLPFNESIDQFVDSNVPDEYQEELEVNNYIAQEEPETTPQSEVEESDKLENSVINDFIDDYFYTVDKNDNAYAFPNHYNKPDVVFESEKLPQPIDVSQPADLIEPAEPNSSHIANQVNEEKSDEKPHSEPFPAKSSQSQPMIEDVKKYETHLTPIVIPANTEIDPDSIPLWLQENFSSDNQTETKYETEISASQIPTQLISSNEQTVYNTHSEPTKPTRYAVEDTITSSSVDGNQNALLYIKHDMNSVLAQLDEQTDFRLRDRISSSTVDDFVEHLGHTDVMKLFDGNRINRTAVLESLQKLVQNKQFPDGNQIVQILELLKQGEMPLPNDGYFDRHYGADEELDQIEQPSQNITSQDDTAEIKELVDELEASIEQDEELRMIESKSLPTENPNLYDDEPEDRMLIESDDVLNKLDWKTRDESEILSEEVKLLTNNTKNPASNNSQIKTNSSPFGADESEPIDHKITHESKNSTFEARKETEEEENYDAKELFDELVPTTELQELQPLTNNRKSKQILIDERQKLIDEKNNFKNTDENWKPNDQFELLADKLDLIVKNNTLTTVEDSSRNEQIR
ncbi:uncharacterized protein LOC131438059 isoform X2 [Malaya genurostris]|uniref:uncharacterized protein LOC131438059 isoform X2 n=1 Tax=Malaya genurostris TaxID=325434 RepID=UPI0026F40302|nr:uncharacterized protein LOC131438059 isoform X2 [Malaya genurostris]